MTDISLQVENGKIVAYDQQGSKVPVPAEAISTGNIYRVAPSEGGAGINSKIRDGATILLGEGTYTLNETILADANNLTIRGSGQFSTILKVADGAEVKPIEIGSDGNRYEYITVKNLAIDGNEANQTDTTLRLHGIDANDGRHLRFKNLYIKDTFPHVFDEGINDGTNTGGNGILCRSPTEDVLVDNLLGWHCGYDTVSLIGSDGKVANSWSFRQGNRGFSGDYRDNPADGFHVVNCHSESGTYPASAFGMRGSFDGSTRGSDFKVSNCSQFMRDGDTGRRAVSVRAVDNFTIENFTARGSNLNGSPIIILDSQNGEVNNVYVDNSPVHGIKMDGSCDGISITSCLINQPANKGILAKGGNHYIGSGTRIYEPDTDVGIDLQASDSMVDGAIITRPGTHGIGMPADDNIIRGCQIKQSNEDGITTGGNDNIIALNRISGSSGQNIDDGGTGTQLLGNVTGSRN